MMITRKCGNKYKSSLKAEEIMALLTLFLGMDIVWNEKIGTNI